MWGIGLRPFAWNFYWLQWFIYTAEVWISIVTTSAGHNGVDKAKSKLGPTTDGITTVVKKLFPFSTNVDVVVKADDIRGIGEGIIVFTGFIGLVYILLQNQMLYENVQQRWVKKFVQIMSSRKGQLYSLWFAFVSWIAVIVCTAIAVVIAEKHGNKISIDVDGTLLSQAAIDGILQLADQPTKYWGHGYIRFMCISPWVQVAFAVPTMIVHLIAVRRTPAAGSSYVSDAERRPTTRERDNSASGNSMSELEKPEVMLEEDTAIPIHHLR